MFEVLPNLISDDYDALLLSTILVSFVLSTFFASVETALTTLSRFQIDQLIDQGGFFKSSLKDWVQHPNRILATILVADTLCDTATATMTAYYMEKNYPEVSVVTVTIVLAVVVLLFGEILPKMIARIYAVQLGPVACRMLLAVDYVLYPATLVISNSLSFLMKAVGLRSEKSEGVKSGDIEAMVMLASKEGSVERDKTKILSSVFQFSKRRVKDIMIPRDRISSISIDANLPQVLDIVRHENHSRYPVFSGSLDRIVGFLHARDLFGILRAGMNQDGSFRAIQTFSLRTCLRRAFFVSEAMMISRVLNDMKSSRIHLAIVKDEWGNVVGLVTLEDILEEVFGEIEDEHDDQVSKPVVDMFGAGVELDGGELIVDLQSKYGIELETSESYSTLNGFLQHYATHQHLTPKTVIIWRQYVFSILSVKDGEIEKVRITEIPHAEDSEEQR